MSKISQCTIAGKHLNLLPKLKDIMNNYTKHIVTPDNFDMEYQMLRMKRGQYKSKELIEMYENGTIKLIYKKDSTAIFTFIPYRDVDNKAKIIVNIAPYVDRVKNETKDGENNDIYVLPYKRIYGLLLAAAGILFGYNKDYDNNSIFTLSVLEVWVDMWTKALTMITSVASSDEGTEYLKYVLGYYLVSRSEFLDEKVYRHHALKVSGASESVKSGKIDAFHIKYEKFDFRDMDINDFIERIIKVEFPMKDLNIQKLIRTFAMNFGTCSTLTPEYREYVAGVIVSKYADFEIYKSRILSKQMGKVVSSAESNIANMFETFLSLSSVQKYN